MQSRIKALEPVRVMLDSRFAVVEEMGVEEERIFNGWLKL